MEVAEGRRYRVHEALGKGGFGTVYRADVEAPGGFSKLVALKVLNADMHGVEDVARRLRDEARILGLVRHRAIVQVDGLVMLDGRWAVVMEYVHGADLAHVVHQGKVPVGCALEVVQEVAAALGVAYERPTPEGAPLRLLHRDIKPSNIQLTAEGEVKVLDFGVARAEFDGREAETRSLTYGSVPYLAPERLDGIDSHAGDVYALGAVLYEMLVGQGLGRTSAHPERHAAFIASARKTLVAACGDPDVEKLVLAMLGYEPEGRPRATEVQREARRLRQRHPDPGLAEWAAGVVPPLIERRETTSDEWSGSLLVESTGQRLKGASTGSTGPRSTGPTEPPGTTWVRGVRTPEPVEPVRAVVHKVATAPPTPRRRRMLPVALGVALICALVAITVAGAVGLAWRTMRGEPPTPPEPVASVIPEAPVEPAPVPEVPLSPPPVAPTPVAPPPVAPPPVGPSPRRVAAPPPLAVGQVVATGDLADVRLVGAAGSFSPGSVPVGEYALSASFGGAEPLPFGTIQVIEGQTVTIHCDSGFLRCKRRP